MSAGALQSFQTFLDDLKAQIKEGIPADSNRLIPVPARILTSTLDLIGIYRTQAELLEKLNPGDSFLKFANMMGGLGADGLEKDIEKYLDASAVAP